MVATPRMREQLNHWEIELQHAEIMLSAALNPFNPFDYEHWRHMCDYTSYRIRMIEKEMYQGA